MRSFTGKKKKEPAAEEDKRKRHGQQIVPAFHAEPEQHQAANPIANAMADRSGEEFNKQMVAGPMQASSGVTIRAFKHTLVFVKGHSQEARPSAKTIWRNLWGERG